MKHVITSTLNLNYIVKHLHITDSAHIVSIISLLLLL